MTLCFKKSKIQTSAHINLICRVTNSRTQNLKLSSTKHTKIKRLIRGEDNDSANVDLVEVNMKKAAKTYNQNVPTNKIINRFI